MSEFLGIVIVCILLAYGASLVFSSQIQASTFLAFLYAFFNVIEPSKGISASYFNVQKGVAALDRINEVLNMKISIYDKPNAISKVSFDNQIEFKGVSFQYAKSSIKVLDDIHFSLKKGEKIAIVGSSGSGKSTLVDLLARFYDVSNGSITIDGVDIKDIKISDLRSLMGMVTQEPILFNDSIRRNIEFGSKTYSDEMIWTILDTAYASDFVREGNKGLDYNIGDRGSKLSGGQRQRLTLARAILRNPAILILDEATSALDSASEMIVQEAMEHVLENRTAIIIAHRLSTIKKVDKIIVIQDGRIVEQGTHDELINKQGEYFNFVSLQSINH